MYAPDTGHVPASEPTRFHHRLLDRIATRANVGPRERNTTDLSSHLHRHQEIRRRFQPHVSAAFQAELAAIFTAGTEPSRGMLRILLPPYHHRAIMLSVGPIVAARSV